MPLRYDTTADTKDTKDAIQAIVIELIKIRYELGYSQAKLAEVSGVPQPVIARLERGVTIPNVRTLLRLLTSMGKTLRIVDM